MADIFSNPISKTNPLGATPKKSYQDFVHISSANPSATNTKLTSPAAQTYIQNQTPVSSTPTPIDNTEKINSIKSQIEDLTKKATALKIGGLTDTSEISKDASGNYGINQTGKYNQAVTGYTNAYQDYINTLKDTSGTTAASNAYNDYTAKQSQAISGLEGKDAAVPISIVRGQQEKLLKQTQPEAQRLQNAIQIAQTEKEQKSAAGLAGVSLQEKLMGLNAPKEPVNVGGVLYQPQPDGTYKQVAGNEKLDTSVVDVNGSKVLINNQTGEVVKNLGGGTVGGGAGTYTQGANPTVDAWAERVQNGTAKITDIPASQAGLRNSVTVALQAMGNSAEGKPTTTEMGKAALTNAKSLLTKFNEKKGTSAVGKSGILGSFGYALIPGTERANFVTDFNALKANLSLEGVKYLKGQGQVSDAERALLAQAVTKLNLSQSEDEFKKTLEAIINKLEGGVQETPTSGTTSSGVKYTVE